MPNQEPGPNEAFIEKKLKDLLSQTGFHVHFADTKRPIRCPDYIAIKRIDGNDYKIAIELKGNFDLTRAIKYGIDTLKEVSKEENYNKLLLLIQNRGNPNNRLNTLNKFQEDNPTNLEILDVSDLEIWSRRLSEELSPRELNPVLYCVRQLSKELIKLISQNPDYLEHLEWRDLERAIAELFNGLGFKVTLTPGSKDGGKDVILECTINNLKKSYIIEIKHWRSGQKVGPKAVKEFVKVIVNEKREKGLYLSTYGFGNNYYETLTEKEKKLVRFGDKEKIVDLCHTYEKVNNGIWTPLETFEDVLFNNTNSLKD